MSTAVSDAVNAMKQAERKIEYLRSLLKQAQPFLPTEDQCCDDDRFVIRRLQADIFEEIR